MASPRPPPRLTGNDKTDLHSLFQWMQGFYEDVVLDEEYTTLAQVNATVDSTVDPVDATAESAQVTANAAAVQAAANKAVLDAQESGEFTIENTDTTFVITLAAAQADTNYYVTFGRAAITSTPSADSYIISGIAKTTTQITVTLKAAPGAATDITFAWHLTR